MCLERGREGRKEGREERECFVLGLRRDEKIKPQQTAAK